MAVAAIEQRVAALEVEVPRLKQQIEAVTKPANPWWQETYGKFADDPLHEEAMKAGREYRESLRPKRPSGQPSDHTIETSESGVCTFMIVSPSIRERLYSRLRQCPSASSVPRSLPVLFFGDLFTASVATVGLNPSYQEFLDRRGIELDGAARRFETLTSLCAADRSSLTDGQCDRAIETMQLYYRPGGSQSTPLVPFAGPRRPWNGGSEL